MILYSIKKKVLRLSSASDMFLNFGQFSAARSHKKECVAETNLTQTKAFQDTSNSPKEL